MQLPNTLFLFITIAGYIVGLGAVTVIDLHGFLGQKSAYWTQATIQTHKVTKPLIWLGTFIAIGGSLLSYNYFGFTNLSYVHLGLFIPMILNGCFLSFWLSPRLLQREKQGRATELLPAKWQNAIKISFIFSFVGWWGGILLYTLYISRLIG